MSKTKNRKALRSRRPRATPWRSVSLISDLYWIMFGALLVNLAISFFMIFILSSIAISNARCPVHLYQDPSMPDHEYHYRSWTPNEFDTPSPDPESRLDTLGALVAVLKDDPQPIFHSNKE